MSGLPWWVIAIVAFSLGATFERFILDRNYLKHVKRMARRLEELHRNQQRKENEP